MWNQFKNFLKRWKAIPPKKILYLPYLLSRSERRVLFLLALTVIVTAAALVGRVYVRVTEQVPQVGKTHTEGALGKPRAINPLYAIANDTDGDLARLVFSRLISYNGRGEVEPDLAESYEISEDGRTYTLTLRENARWHDGEPVKADDVAFTIKTIQNPLYQSPLRANWQGVDVERLDERTVRFILRTAYAPFIENLAVGILPKHLWENINPERALLHELNLKPVGSGPYKLNKFGQDKEGVITSYELSRNSRYYREGPYLRKIVFKFFDTEEDLITAWRRGVIDGFGPFPIRRKQEFSLGRAKILSVPLPRLFGLFFNEDKAPALEEKAVREAIARAIDKAGIAALVSTGGAVPIDGALAALTPENDAGVTRYEFNPARSREILDKAKWTDANEDGVREKTVTENRKRVERALRFTLATSDWPDLLRVAEFIQQSLAEIGIDVAIETRTFGELEASVIRPRNFDILLFGQAYGYEPDPFPFWHSSQIKDPGLNVSLYANKKVDALLEEARRNADPEARMAAYNEIEKNIANDLPAIFLYSQLYNYLLPQDMRGVEIQEIALPADRFNEVHQWYQETQRVF